MRRTYRFNVPRTGSYPPPYGTGVVLTVVSPKDAVLRAVEHRWHDRPASVQESQSQVTLRVPRGWVYYPHTVTVAVPGCAADATIVFDVKAEESVYITAFF